MRFGPFELDRDSGDLWRDDGGRRFVTRLPPQPARLLAHLIERAPRVVGQDEIKQLLWPDVEVESEESLHSCVRKIRAALDDSATTPRWVETVPRRGYRFIGDVPAETAVPPPAAPATVRRPGAVAIAAAFAVVVVAIVGSLWAGKGPAAAAGAERIAVMPFEPSTAGSPLAPNNDLAESIVRALVERRGSAVEVIGPTTTEAYTGRLRELIADFAIDYVVNARDAAGPAGPRILVEVIRARDGAHVWVRYLDELAGGGAADVIAAAAAETR